MMASLLIICFLLIFLAVRKFMLIDWRSSFLLAALVWGLSLTAITEVLSYFGWLSFGPVAASWIFFALLLLLTNLIVPSPKDTFSIKPNLSALTPFEISILALLSIMVMWITVLAWVTPPNTWDSMTYHMSRVMHWMQNKSVAFYPTYFLPQLHQNPWSEFAILNFQILSGSDRFANFVQWFSMIGTLIGVSLLAKELNATTRGQVLTAFVCATIPMGILQGSSTQTDYVCSFWLVCFIYFGMRATQQGGLIPALSAGIALGLSILTKGTAYIFAFPFAIWILLSFIKSHQEKKTRYIFISLIIALTINLGHYSRNYDLYGNILGPLQEEGGYKYKNEQITFSTITSNLVRNIGLHLATPIEQSNIFWEQMINSFNEIIGISPDDERTTWKGSKFHIPRISISEDTTGNLIHTLLIFISIYLYLFRQNKEKIINYYLFSWVFGALLFSAILKWQPWNSRLHLPFFVLGSPFISLIFSRLKNQKIAGINYVNITIAVLFVTSLPLLFMSFTKPIFRSSQSIFTESRIDQYFATRKTVETSYLQAMKTLKDLNCSNIGLIVEKNSVFFEYPFWALLLDNQSHESIRIINLNVKNISKIKYDNRYNDMVPCAVVIVGPITPESISISNVTYIRVWSSNSIAVLKQANIEFSKIQDNQSG